MSLKAKIEAVIYASEEPVTLAQLVGLLGHEAQPELDQIAARQQRLHLAGSEEEDVEGAEGDAQMLTLVEGTEVEEPICGGSRHGAASPGDRRSAQVREFAGGAPRCGVGGEEGRA